MSKTRTVYAVTSGAYSDYGIRAIFAEREPAEEYVRLRNQPDEQGYTHAEAQVEVWEMETGSRLPTLRTLTHITTILNAVTGDPHVNRFGHAQCLEFRCADQIPTTDQSNRPRTSVASNPRDGTITITATTYGDPEVALKALRDRVAQEQARIKGVA